MQSASPWSAQQLAEFLAAVSAYTDAENALRGGIELISEAFDAEVGAIALAGSVVASWGFPTGRIPMDTIAAVAVGTLATLDIPGVGTCEVLGVPIELSDRQGKLLVARSGSGFDREESSLLRAMARVLSLAVGNLRVLVSLRDRQVLLERLSTIQRSISIRLPIAEVLDAITSGVSALLDDDFVALHIRDAADANTLTAASTYGVPDTFVNSLTRRFVGEGVTGRAIAENALVIIEDYQESPNARPDALATGVQAVMAAPIHDHGETTGSLMVASLTRGRVYSAPEQELLLSFAELASLAVTDTKTVDALHAALDEAVHRALHDPLTGLANRTRLLDRLSHALSVRRQRDLSVVVLYIDLDDFKSVNDQFGHQVGDRLLIEVAKRLVASVHGGDTVARIGGDEFAILIENAGGVRDAERAAEQILLSMRPQFVIGEIELTMTASIGIALSDKATLLADEVLRNSDVAMYRAKSAGKRRYVTFEPEMYESLLERIELEADLRKAVERGELEVYFQPIISLADNTLKGTEALARWHHPTRGDIPPLTFIPLAEATGLIVDLGSQIMSRACSWLGNWRKAHPDLPMLTLSINVSAWQLQRPEFVQDVAGALKRAGLPAHSVILEITESVLMRDADATLVRLHELSALGVRLALDDFGTGFSSLSYLRRFPVDTLKIDRSFIASLRSGEETLRQLTEAILVLGSSLGLECVAEGIEHVDELDALLSLGCQWGQGLYFAAPMPPDAFAAYLADHFSAMTDGTVMKRSGAFRNG